MLTRDERDFAKHVPIKIKNGMLLYKGREVWTESELRNYKREIDDVVLFTRCKKICHKIIKRRLK